MIDKRALLAIVLLLPSIFTAETRTPARKASQPVNEPFHTFDLMDAKLAALSHQQEALKNAIAPQNPSRATSTKPHSREHPWTKSAIEIGRTTGSIATLATKQQKRYHSLHQPFGVRAFRSLQSCATAMEAHAKALRTTEDHSAAIQRQQALQEASLKLVLQFQAISGGYGALRCSAKQMPCCDPKDGDQVLACRWICVSSATKCSRGFTGPGRASTKGGKIH